MRHNTVLSVTFVEVTTKQLDDVHVLAVLKFLCLIILYIPEPSSSSPLGFDRASN